MAAKKRRVDRLGGTPKKAKVQQKNPEHRAVEVKLQRDVFDLTIRGFNARQISAQLNITRQRAARLKSRALDEYLSDRDELVHEYTGKGIAQADALLRTWMPRAMGYVHVSENGKRTVIEPDPKAAMIVARVLRDRNILIGYGTSVKVEHTGAKGGPIMTANLDARAIAAITRESFANAPQVILEEGQDVSDVPELARTH